MTRRAWWRPWLYRLFRAVERVESRVIARTRLCLACEGTGEESLYAYPSGVPVGQRTCRGCNGTAIEVPLQTFTAER